MPDLIGRPPTYRSDVLTTRLPSPAYLDIDIVKGIIRMKIIIVVIRVVIQTRA